MGSVDEATRARVENMRLQLYLGRCMSQKDALGVLRCGGGGLAPGNPASIECTDWQTTHEIDDIYLIWNGIGLTVVKCC